MHEDNENIAPEVRAKLV